MIGIEFSNVRDLTFRLLESLKDKNKSYTPRPFNRYKVERSLWWLVPSKDFPAYKYGKFMIEKRNNEILIGIHVEKGLEKGDKLQKDETLDDSWVWHDLMNAFENGELKDTLISIQESLGNEIKTEINVQVPVLSYDEIISLENGQFVQKGHVVDLKNVPHKLRSIEDVEWYWIDIFVQFVIPIKDDSTTKELIDFEIADRLMAPLEKWVK